MTVFDIVTGIILLLFLIKGLKNGFVIELASLVALVLGIILAVKFSDVTAGWLSGFVTSRFVSVLSYILIFVGVVILVHLFAQMIDKLMKAIALGWLNRLMGAFFGIIKAAFFISAVMLALQAFGYSDRAFSEKTRSESLLFKPLKEFAPATLRLLEIQFKHLIPDEHLPESPPPVMT